MKIWDPIIKWGRFLINYPLDSEADYLYMNNKSGMAIKNIEKAKLHSICKQIFIK